MAAGRRRVAEGAVIAKHTAPRIASPKEDSSMLRRSFVLSASAAACAPREGALDLRTMLARHTEARGGAAALDAVRSVRNEAEVVEPSFTVRGPYIANADGLMRVDIFADGQNVFSEGVDRMGAWSWQPGGAPEPASPTASGALRHGIVMASSSMCLACTASPNAATR
jgi:hypothetical protein